MLRPRINYKAFLASVVLTGAFLFSAIVLQEVRSSRRSPSPVAAHLVAAVPEFALPDLLDATVTRTSADFAGKPLVINVFDYTCVPCVAEMPMLSRVSLEHPDVGFLGVHLLLKRDRAAKFVRNLHVAYPVLYDGEGVFATTATGLPTTIFLDRNSHEVDRVIGPIAEGDLRQKLRRLAS